MFVEVVEVEGGRREFFDGRGKDSSLKGGHRGFELGWDESEGLVFNSKGGVELDGFGDEVGVELVETVVEERGEVPGKFV